MSTLTFSVQMPGMLTTVQDSGRWSYQGKGMPVAGAMDMQSFALGNILVGNDENAAALEVTLLGPTLSVMEGEGVAAVTGAELGFTVNGAHVANWTVVTVREGDTLSFAGPRSGCRAYLCVSGGIDVPHGHGEPLHLYAREGGRPGRARPQKKAIRCAAANRLLSGNDAKAWSAPKSCVLSAIPTRRCASFRGHRTICSPRRGFPLSTARSTSSPTAPTGWDIGWTASR